MVVGGYWVVTTVIMVMFTVSKDGNYLGNHGNHHGNHCNHHGNYGNHHCTVIMVIIIVTIVGGMEGGIPNIARFERFKGQGSRFEV